MSFEIRFSHKADETYTAVTDQLRERWGDRFVSRLEVKLDQCFNNLTISPLMYPIIHEETGLRKCLLHKNCSMLYSVSGNVIMIAYSGITDKSPCFNISYYFPP